MASKVTLADVAKYFKETLKWSSVRTKNDGSRLDVNVEYPKGTYEIVITDDQTADLIRLNQWYPFVVPPDKYLAMAELLSLLNDGKYMTTCRMTIANGQIGWTTFLYVRDAAFSPTQFQQALDIVGYTADDYSIPILSVIGGKDAKKAFDEYCVENEKAQAQAVKAATTCGEEEHAWKFCKCEKCGKTRDSNHDLFNGTCCVCGKVCKPYQAGDFTRQAIAAAKAAGTFRNLPQ